MICIFKVYSPTGHGSNGENKNIFTLNLLIYSNPFLNAYYVQGNMLNIGISVRNRISLQGACSLPYLEEDQKERILVKTIRMPLSKALLHFQPSCWQRPWLPLSSTCIFIDVFAVNSFGREMVFHFREKHKFSYNLRIYRIYFGSKR